MVEDELVYPKGTSKKGITNKNKNHLIGFTTLSQKMKKLTTLVYFKAQILKNILIKWYGSMSNSCIIVNQSLYLNGELPLEGAKNAVLVIMASSLLVVGVTTLRNVPPSDDVYHMSILLESLGARVTFHDHEKTLIIDTTLVDKYSVRADIMRKIRASILVMGPLLARFGRVSLAIPGGDMIGARPIDFHLRAFAKMGAEITKHDDLVAAHARTPLRPIYCVLEYPSVGATENILMAAVLTAGTTKIVNAALEPEVFDLIAVLRKMGARIAIEAPGSLVIEGVTELHAVEHEIMFDRLEAGTYLLAAAITRGSISLPTAPVASMEVFLEKLSDMGHTISVGKDGRGLTFTATQNPRAVSFKTMPYPGFPTDLQPLMLAVQCVADGVSIIDETVYENRLIHVRELQRMGAQITVNGTTATIRGVDTLYGAQVIASDIRAGAALVLAGLAASGNTTMTGVHHLKRGYHDLPGKLGRLGAKIIEQ